MYQIFPTIITGKKGSIKVLRPEPPSNKVSLSMTSLLVERNERNIILSCSNTIEKVDISKGTEVFLRIFVFEKCPTPLLLFNIFVKCMVPNLV